VAALWFKRVATFGKALPPQNVFTSVANNSWAVFQARIPSWARYFFIFFGGYDQALGLSLRSQGFEMHLIRASYMHPIDMPTLRAVVGSTRSVLGKCS
jgi:hypothetical protein